MKKFFTIAILLFCFSCAIEDVSYNYPNNQDYQRKSRAGGVYDNDFVVYGKDASLKTLDKKQ